MAHPSYLVDGRCRPKQAYIVLTKHCNLSCAHCYLGGSPRQTETMSWPLRRTVLQELADYKIRIFALTGGEVLYGDPLLGKTLRYLQRLQRETGYPKDVVLQTNGTWAKSLTRTEVAGTMSRLARLGVTGLDITSKDPYHRTHLDYRMLVQEAHKVFWRYVFCRGCPKQVTPIGRALRLPRCTWDRRVYRRPYFYLSVDPQGHVYPCCWMPKSLGSLQDEPLAEILRRARRPGSIWRKLAEAGGFGHAHLSPQLVEVFGDCGACHQYFRSLDA